MANKKIYHVENYKEFPENVTAIFENTEFCEDGFKLSDELEKIGYKVNDQGLCGSFETFQKIDDGFSILYSDITESEKNEFNKPF